ncbi:PTS transporter subunit EIIC [Aeromonas hydrophila]|uniref:PTS transporter subunit EIIC n=1 Tax=Aeromonas hydrophila TaxID=644 RepID=A0A926FPH0_AERHY|nr:PTS transporter subunit EIIC [Aeromonas hydrophila]
MTVSIRRYGGRHCNHAEKSHVRGRDAGQSSGTVFQIVHIIEEGGWTVFRNMPLIFAIGLPIGLANKAQARACLSVLVSFMTWNYFINAMGMTWGDYFGVDFNQAVGGERAGHGGRHQDPGHQHHRCHRHLRHCHRPAQPVVRPTAAGLSRHLPGQLVRHHRRLLRDDPLRLADPAGLAQGTDGHRLPAGVHAGLRPAWRLGLHLP